MLRFRRRGVRTTNDGAGKRRRAAVGKRSRCVNHMPLRGRSGSAPAAGATSLLPSKSTHDVSSLPPRILREWPALFSRKSRATAGCRVALQKLGSRRAAYCTPNANLTIPKWLTWLAAFRPQGPKTGPKQALRATGTRERGCPPIPSRRVLCTRRAKAVRLRTGGRKNLSKKKARTHRNPKRPRGPLAARCQRPVDLPPELSESPP